MQFFLMLALWIMPSFANEYQKREKLKGTVDVTEHKGDFVPLEASLEHHSGETVRLKELFESDKPVILTLNYYSCETLCSVQLNALLNGLKNLDWELGKEFKAVTLSIDPDETAELAEKKRKTYLKDLFSAKADLENLNEDQKKQLQNLIDGNNWEFLVGGQKEIDEIAESVGYGFAYDPATKQYLHPAVVMILSPDGMISQYLYGLSYGAQDLKFAMIEASNGAVGSAMEKLILSCYSYDELAGKYTPTAFKIMRLGGLITVFVMAFALLIVWRKELTSVLSVGSNDEISS